MPKARLPFSNRYVFAKVMQDNPDLCRELVERVLGVDIGRIESIEVESEAASIARRGVRFDVYLRGEQAAFEVEMQTYDQRGLPLRMRYYRSQLDRRLLDKGSRFTDLRPVYVIFICTHDPFGAGLPRYTFTSSCEEDASVEFDNGAVDVVLNAAGDLSKASSEVASLLEYVLTNNAGGADPLVNRLAQAVDEAYDDEEWVVSLITLEDDIRDAAEGAARRAAAEATEKGLAKGRAEEQEKLRELLLSVQESGGSIEDALRALDGSE